MSKTILITGGGTGGHISPGVAIYERAMEMNNLSPLFLASFKDRRFSSLNDVEVSRLLFYSPPALTKNPFKLPFFIVKFLRAIFVAKRILKKKNVAAIVGMGGYVSAPALFAAKMKKIPIFLCEQNSVPGKVTLKFEKNAEKIFGTFPESIQFFKNESAYQCVGNPIRHRVLRKISKREARKLFHLGHCSKVILVIGGSQGALRLNELIYGLKKTYPQDFKSVGVIWSTGESLYEEFRDKIQNELGAGSIYLSPFLKDVGEAYMACDLAISRSGSGVMMELASLGIPSVLIPFPHAAADHQNKNADSFVDAGAAIKISDEYALPERAGELILGLLNDDSKLAEMSRKAKILGKANAAEDIINQIDQFFKK